jgi:hypothetical protein
MKLPSKPLFNNNINTFSMISVRNAFLSLLSLGLFLVGFSLVSAQYIGNPGGAPNNNANTPIYTNSTIPQTITTDLGIKQSALGSFVFSVLGKSWVDGGVYSAGPVVLSGNVWQGSDGATSFSGLTTTVVSSLLDIKGNLSVTGTGGTYPGIVKDEALESVPPVTTNNLVCATSAGVLVRCSNTTPPPPPTEICNDGIDNDGDGDIDAADSDCPAPPVVPPTAVSNCYVVSNAQGSQHWTLRCDPAKNADNSDVTQYEVDFLEYQNNYPTGVWTPEGTYNGAQYCDPLSCVTGYVRVAGVITSGTPFANSLYRIRGINAAGPGPWEYYVGSNIQSFYDSQVTFTENATFPATALNTTIEWNPIASRLYLDGLAPGGFVIARCSAGGTCFNYPPPGSGQGISINSNIRIEAVIPYTGSTPTQSTKTYASMNGTAGDTYMLLHRKPLRAMPSVGSTVTLSNLSGYELVDYITR